MIELSEQMTEMSKMMKKGTVSDEDMRALQDKMKKIREGMSGMMK